ncbi:integrase family protein [Thioalkalivibrio sp. ALE31]|uniref:tyrosine-type recombinase/integrase n=1 Tax=Thioalkalivibrio sp. ALE31 TaxID=1158182 RepID=UPI000380F986|nr:integrase family protein [Thioalkalivibrio sp. ALE31]
MATSNATRVRLTRERLKAFTCPPERRQAFLWDSEAPGLGLRVTKAGAKAYIFQSRLHGRSLRVTIGPVGHFETVEDARTEARRLAELVRQGVHPEDDAKAKAAEAEAARAERTRATVTLGDAWTDYVAERSGEWSEAHRHDHDRAMTAPGLPRRRSRQPTTAGALYSLRGERLRDLTAERLARWMETESAKRPAVAARAFRLLRTFLNWAAEHPDYRGLADTSALLTGAVRRKVPRQKPRDDVLQREQLAPWFEAVRRITNPVASAYLQTLLLTGARSGELATLRWDDVDFQWRALTIRDKAEGERTIPLTPYVAALLAGLPRRNGWVFSSPQSESGRIGAQTRVHTRAVEAAGLPPVTLHGLRRSFGTLSEWVECPVGIVAQIQGHKPSAIAEKYYRRRPLDLLRQWHVRIEGWMLEQAGMGQPEYGTGERLRVAK